MADNDRILRPVQVVMQGEGFHKKPERRGGGNQKDFFAGDDTGFARHKAVIRKNLSDFANTLTEHSEPVGFVHVKLRESGLAKTHRPLDALFVPKNHLSLIGGDEDGDLIVHGSPRAFQELGDLIAVKAEAHPRTRTDKKTNKQVQVVSEYRSELGAIEEIRLHDRDDRISFETDLAIELLKRPDAIGSYAVDLFRIDEDIVGPGAVERLVTRFLEAIGEIPGGLEVKPVLSAALRAQLTRPSLALSVRLLRDPARRLIELPPEIAGPARERRLPAPAAAPDLDRKRHEDLLALLGEQSIVRTVHLPLILEEGKTPSLPAGRSLQFPPPASGYDYPVVGVLDGGVAATPALAPWIAGSAGQVPAAERNERHGTIIAGLCAGAHLLNPGLSAHVEPAGVKVFDLDIFPREDLRRSYYPDYETLFDQIDESIRAAKARAGVRVINMSFACGPPQTGAYSVVADAFDSIARKNDIIFVVAAGNLEGAESRPAWPADADAAVRMLAAQSGNQGIKPPAEAFHAITVGAVNPPGFDGFTELMPTTYTRRGPGTGYSRKPDLSHIGGIAPGPSTGNRSGLASFLPDGSIAEICGTSFAAPPVAATLATLDQRLERRASRELLHALMVHRAKRAPGLSAKSLRHIAPEFVGFGMPVRADEALVDAPHEITIVFDQVLPPDRILEFGFAWPQSLVTPEGACRGEVEVTMVYSPPIDRSFNDEAMRVELDAHLRQEAIDPETGEVTWGGQLDHDGAVTPPGTKKREKEMLRNGVKWSPVKRLSASMPQGRGTGSNWRLLVEPLARKTASFPEQGVRFALLMTIRDLKKAAPVNDQMRALLIGQGITLSDIHVAARVRQAA